MTDKEINWFTSLLELNELSQIFNIKIFLDAGTLLGAIRENKFIEWDNDIDLGLIWDDYSEVILKNFMLAAYKNGWEINYSTTIISLIKNNVEVNICIYYRNNDLFNTHYVRYYSGNPFLIFCKNVKKGIHKVSFGSGFKFKIKKIILNNSLILNILSPTLLNILIKEEIKVVSIPSHFFEKLSITNFYNCKFNVPYESINYLIYRYGKDWNIPRKEFDYFNEKSQIYKN